MICADTLNVGVHFPESTAPEDLGYKALAVNLSDLAAMAATPRWALLTLSLPEADARWLDRFAGGWKELADPLGVSLVGGDMTRGPLSVTVVALGEVAPGAALTRGGACPGDLIAVTGELGGAALALHELVHGFTGGNPGMFHLKNLRRLQRPKPRVEAGLALAGLATACIDLSDGLSGDLAHLQSASGVGARVQLDRLPLAPGLMPLERELQVSLAANGGDDYELCFTFPPDRRADVTQALDGASMAWVEVGEITDGTELVWMDGRNRVLVAGGYDHFAPKS